MLLSSCQCIFWHSKHLFSNAHRAGRRKSAGRTIGASARASTRVSAGSGARQSSGQRVAWSCARCTWRIPTGPPGRCLQAEKRRLGSPVQVQAEPSAVQGGREWRRRRERWRERRGDRWLVNRPDCDTSRASVHLTRASGCRQVHGARRDEQTAARACDRKRECCGGQQADHGHAAIAGVRGAWGSRAIEYPTPFEACEAAWEQMSKRMAVYTGGQRVRKHRRVADGQGLTGCPAAPLRRCPLACRMACRCMQAPPPPASPDSLSLLLFQLLIQQVCDPPRPCPCFLAITLCGPCGRGCDPTQRSAPWAARRSDRRGWQASASPERVLRARHSGCSTRPPRRARLQACAGLCAARGGAAAPAGGRPPPLAHSALTQRAQ